MLTRFVCAKAFLAKLDCNPAKLHRYFFIDNRSAFLPILHLSIETPVLF